MIGGRVVMNDKEKYLKECERDSIKKRKKYIKERLKKIMPYFKSLTVEQQKKITHIVYIYLSNEDKNNPYFFNEVIKKKNCEIIQDFLDYISDAEDGLKKHLMYSNPNLPYIYKEYIEKKEKNIEYIYTHAYQNDEGEVERDDEQVAINKISGYLILSGELFLLWVKIMQKKYKFSKLELNSFFFQSLFNFFKVSLENIYYSRGLSEQSKTEIHSIIISELENIKNSIIKTNKRKTEVKDLGVLLYSNFSLLQSIYRCEASIDMKEAPIFSIEATMKSEPIVYDGTSEDIPRFKDMDSAKKKDPLYQNKMERIEILIDVLKEQNGGIILDKKHGIYKNLYRTIFLEKEKVESKLISTKLNRIVRWKTEESSKSIPKADIDFFEKYLRKIIHISYGKENDYDRIMFNLQYFLDILKEIFSNSQPRVILNELKGIIYSFQKINNEIRKIIYSK